MAWHSLGESRRSMTALPCPSRSCSTRCQSMVAMRSATLFTGVRISAIAFMSGLLSDTQIHSSDTSKRFMPLAFHLLLSNSTVLVVIGKNRWRVCGLVARTTRFGAPLFGEPLLPPVSYRFGVFRVMAVCVEPQPPAEACLDRELFLRRLPDVIEQTTMDFIQLIQHV